MPQDEGLLDAEKEELKETKIRFFHVGAHNVPEAYEIGDIILMEMFEGDEDSYEITKVEERLDIFLANWWDDDEEEECRCPYCMVSSSPPDDIIRFICPKCGEEIVVADGDWEKIYCRNCDKVLHRKNIKESNGNFIYEELRRRKKNNEKNKEEGDNGTDDGIEKTE